MYFFKDMWDAGDAITDPIDRAAVLCYDHYAKGYPILCKSV